MLAKPMAEVGAIHGSWWRSITGSTAEKSEVTFANYPLKSREDVAILCRYNAQLGNPPGNWI